MCFKEIWDNSWELSQAENCMCLAIFTSLWVLAPPSYEGSYSDSGTPGALFLFPLCWNHFVWYLDCSGSFFHPFRFQLKCHLPRKSSHEYSIWDPNPQAILSHFLLGFLFSTAYYLKIIYKLFTYIFNFYSSASQSKFGGNMNMHILCFLILVRAKHMGFKPRASMC